GNSLYQPVLDRYIAGEDVPLEEARKVWRNTTGLMCGTSAFFAQFFPLVRRINQSQPPDKRLRVVAGDTPIDWEAVRAPSTEARLQLGPLPSLVRTKDLALPGVFLSRVTDGYLYFGPPDLLLAEPRPADVFVDAEYMAELRRRAALRPGPGNDQIDPDKVRAQ